MKKIIAFIGVVFIVFAIFSVGANVASAVEMHEVSVFAVMFPFGYIFIGIIGICIFASGKKKSKDDESELRGIFSENFSTEQNSYKDKECDNSCVEEGDDIFAQTREDNLAKLHDRRKTFNKQSPGKIYCKHCGVEMLYQSDRCEWCGEKQD